MKKYILPVLEVLFASISYVLLHELGHFIFAFMFDLSPSFVLTQQNAAGMFLISAGVAYTPITGLPNLLVILGATILPAAISLILFTIGSKKNNRTLVTISMIYFLFIIVNFIPVGEISDGYKLFSMIS